MRKIILMMTAVCLLGLTTQIDAQQPGMKNMPPEERAKKQTEMMKDTLKLSADQVTKVSSINLKYAKKMDEARNSSTDTEVVRKKASELNDQKDAELKKILTPQQYKTYEKIMADLKARRRSGPQR